MYSCILFIDCFSYDKETYLFSHTILLSYPDHLDLDSILEESPDLGCHFLPGLPHRPQPLQLLKCGVCLQETGKCVCAHVYVKDWKDMKLLAKVNMHTQLFLTNADVHLYNIQSTRAHMYRRHGKSFRCMHIDTCICVHNIQKLKYTHCHSSSNLQLHTIPTLYSVKTGFAKTTHTFPHKEFPWACSDNQQLCNKCTLCQIVKYLLHAYRWNPGCVWVQCFVWQIPKPGYFSIQSCAVGDESTQEYTQLNAFLLCVSDSGWQWGQWSRGDNGGHWWQLAECIQPAQWIPVRFPQVSASSFPEEGESRGGGGWGIP